MTKKRESDEREKKKKKKPTIEDTLPRKAIFLNKICYDCF